MMQVVYLGLDISKDKIDFCLMFGNESENFIIDNELSGFNVLLSCIKQHKIDWHCIHACCEYTNIYHQAIVSFLYDRGIKVSVINPLTIKNYAKIQMKRIKTDKQDSKLIALYCHHYQPKSWQPKSKQASVLQEFCRRSEQLKQMIVVEQNRLLVAGEYARVSIQRTITYLKQELSDCQQTMCELIKSDDTLKHQHEILLTIPGIGKSTAPILMSLLCDLDKFPTAKHLISYLGLSPIVKQSGKSRGFVRLSKMGDRLLRKILYMPARAACTRSKLWRSWFEDRIKQGKHPKKIYIMMMCKILRYAYTCLKNNTPFNENLHKRV